MKHVDRMNELANQAVKTYPFGLRTIMELFDVGPLVAVSVLSAAILILLLGAFAFVQSAPPSELTITSGPEGSVFQKNAKKYAAILEKNGVKVHVLTSEGSHENLQRLSDPNSHVDIGIVQAGIVDQQSDKLISLGSISYQPLMLFYRGKPLQYLTDLKGKKIAIGNEGSGTRDFALKLLDATHMKEEDGTKFVSWDADTAAPAIENGSLDAAFIMSESASSEIMQKLLKSKDVHLMNMKLATAYSRKIEFLNELIIPEGAIDFAMDVPFEDKHVLGPMVELIADKNLHPALSDLVLEAATEVHNHPGIFQHRGEFPAAIDHAIKMSPDASRFYKSGKSLLYRYLPFWLASLVSRIIVVFLPILVLMIPAIKSVPAFFKWRSQSKIHRRYRELLVLEQEFLTETDSDKLKRMREDFDQIEERVNSMQVPAAFADQYYGLKGHIDFVKQIASRRLTEEKPQLRAN